MFLFHGSFRAYTTSIFCVVAQKHSKRPRPKPIWHPQVPHSCIFWDSSPMLHSECPLPEPIQPPSRTPRTFHPHFALNLHLYLRQVAPRKSKRYTAQGFLPLPPRHDPEVLLASSPAMSGEATSPKATPLRGYAVGSLRSQHLAHQLVQKDPSNAYLLRCLGSWLASTPSLGRWRQLLQFSPTGDWDCAQRATG